MAWSASKIFTAFPTNAFANAVAYDLSGAGIDTFKAALYNTSITPDQTVALANTAYNVDQWGTANEIYDGAEWTQAGTALTGPPAITNPTTTTIMFDASDTVSAGTSATLTSVCGTLVYDDTVSDYGICYNYFGSCANSVTDGTFTIVWHTDGIFRFTV